MKLDTVLVGENPYEYAVTQGLLYNRQMNCIQVHILSPHGIDLCVVRTVHYGGICSAESGSVMQNDNG